MTATGSESTAAQTPPAFVRLPGPDVVRAVALIGVVVMNYHGFLILRLDPAAARGDGTLDRFFDPWTGPLSTRFAATFVLIAGVGVTLLTRRVESPDDVAAMRWRLVRRGGFLYVLGQLLDEIWAGTIIVYYGAMFVLAAALFTMRSRWVVAIGAASALAGWWINAWLFWRREDGESTAWLTSPGDDSVRGYAFDLFVNGTHPLLPWLAYFCAGIVLGRVFGRSTTQLNALVVGAGLTLFAGATLVSEFATTPFRRVVLSTDPFSRSLVYVASAFGTALVAFATLSWIAERFADRDWLDPLRRAGQMSLTIYVAHILVFNLLVDWLEVIEPGGLGTSLGFAAAFWVVAIAAAALWHRHLGRGPLERVYRAFGN